MRFRVSFSFWFTNTAYLLSSWSSNRRVSAQSIGPNTSITKAKRKTGTTDCGLLIHLRTLSNKTASRTWNDTEALAVQSSPYTVQHDSVTHMARR